MKENKTMNYSHLKAKELKGILRDRNLKLSGKKSEMIERLQQHDQGIIIKPVSGAKSSVLRKLQAAGVKDPDSVSECVKSAIYKGHILVDSPESLEKIVCIGNCLECSTEIDVCLKDVLYQPDYAGLDYEDGGQDATVRCSNEDCPGIYVTRICEGKPTFDNGKFHNHCPMCSGFGKCIGDYRTRHCTTCNKHYYGSISGCPKCDDEDDRECSIM